MADGSLKQKTISGMFWRFGERILAQGVSFVLSVILARILMPDNYGTVGLLLVFINIANVFVTNGFGESLVQGKDVTDGDYSTIFHCSFALSLLLYGAIFLAAPAVSAFFGREELTLMLRVFALKLPVSALNGVQQAYVQRNMLFKKFFWATLLGTVLSAVLGIWMAYRGFGAWALIAQYLTNSVVDTIMLALAINWRPRAVFSAASAQRLMRYGWKLTLTALVNTGYDELRSLIIGKYYSSADLAYYNKGTHFPKLIMSNVNVAVNSVTLPVFAKKYNAGENVRAAVRQAIRVNSYLLFPLMTALALTAQPLIRLVLTDKWLPCVPYLRILCAYYAYVPLATLGGQGLKAVGRSDLYFRDNILRRVLYIAILLLVVRRGVMAIAMTNIAAIVISFIVNGYYLRGQLGYTYTEQLRDLAPQLLLSLAAGAGMYLAGRLPLPDLALIAVQAAAGAALYWGLSRIFQLKVYGYLLDTLRRFRKAKHEGGTGA